MPCLHAGRTSFRETTLDAPISRSSRPRLGQFSGDFLLQRVVYQGLVRTSTDSIAFHCLRSFIQTHNDSPPLEIQALSIALSTMGLRNMLTIRPCDLRTLQEIIAPASVIFCSSEWTVLGNICKISRLTDCFETSSRQRPNSNFLEYLQFDLIGWVSDVTNVQIEYLNGAQSIQSASIARRMSW